MPVTVTVDVPADALLLAARVNWLAVAVPTGLNTAVTPAGNPDAARLTLPVKPFTAAIGLANALQNLWAS